MKFLQTFQSFNNYLLRKSDELLENISNIGDVTYYHGNRKGDFPPEKRRFADAIFFTNSLNFAKNFAGQDERDLFPNGAVWEVKLSNDMNICDPMDQRTMKELNLKGVIQKMLDEEYVDPVNEKKFRANRGKGFKGYDYDTNKEFDLNDVSESVYNYLWLIKNGSWQIIECNPIVQAIKNKGYDGFQIVERGVKNLAIFDKKFIKDFKKLDFQK